MVKSGSARATLGLKAFPEHGAFLEQCLHVLSTELGVMLMGPVQGFAGMSSFKTLQPTHRHLPRAPE